MLDWLQTTALLLGGACLGVGSALMTLPETALLGFVVIVISGCWFALALAFDQKFPATCFVISPLIRRKSAEDQERKLSNETPTERSAALT